MALSTYAELPEVEALTDFLTEHLVGRRLVRVLPVAVSVLKTYDPPVTAVEGAEVTAVRRHGKFLDVENGRRAPSGQPIWPARAGSGGGTGCRTARPSPARTRWRCAWRWRRARAPT